jgi:hypothetical protein
MSTEPVIYYFGALSRRSGGHFLFAPGQRPASSEKKTLPWPDVDAVLCPGFVAGGTPEADQIEGRAQLHHRDGWTALAFWDRSVDARFGANSVFIAKGQHDFEGMIALARKYFPDVWGRWQFQVQLAGAN